MFVEQKISRKDFLKLCAVFVLGAAAFSPMMMAGRKLGIIPPASPRYGRGTYGFSSY